MMLSFSRGRNGHGICIGNHDRRGACEKEFDSSESAENDGAVIRMLCYVVV